MVRIIYSNVILIMALLFFCCTPKQKKAPKDFFNLFESNVKHGDLVLRTKDELTSRMIANFNDKDKRFSHCGIVKEVNGKYFVYDINPITAEGKTDDTIKSTPIRLFLDTVNNERFGLFRFKNLTKIDFDNIFKTIDSFSQMNVRFDEVFDISDDSKMYCSEFITKSIERGSGNKITFKQQFLNDADITTVRMFFAKAHKKSNDFLKNYPFVKIEALYDNGKTMEILNHKNHNVLN